MLRLSHLKKFFFVTATNTFNINQCRLPIPQFYGSHCMFLNKEQKTNFSLNFSKCIIIFFHR